MKLLVALMAAAVLSGQTTKPKPPPPQATQVQAPQTPAPQVQPPAALTRFQLIMLGEFRADQYLLDTESGRMWQIVKATTGGMVLQPVPFIHLNGESYELPEDAAMVAASIQSRKKQWFDNLFKTK